jgi:hypothetical protein
MSRPRVTVLASALLAAMVLAIGATSAMAALVSFQSPSKNIGCIGDGHSIRCDIRQTSATPPHKPARCHLDWGDAFGIAPAWTRGRGICHGDTALPAPGQKGVRTIAYGHAIHLGKLVCISRTSAFTCQNRKKHGFRLSRTVIRLF